MVNPAIDTDEIPFRLINWALLFSPLQDDATLAMAWSQLALAPVLDDALRHTAVKTFFIDLPQPQMPLTFSNALQRESSACHEDWMRISQQLGLERAGPVLPPDHMALACELLVHAWAHNDKALVQGMYERYFSPWLTLAQSRVDGPLASAIIVPFSRDVVRACVPG